MTNAERIEYKKAHVELYEIIKRLSNAEKDKIPPTFMNNLKNDMDENYVFVMDETKSLLDQDYKVETKALLVELYERYLASEDEKDFWKKYDRICLNMIEERKKEQYNPDDLFKKKDNNENKEKIECNNLPIKMEKERLFDKILKWVYNIFKKY